MGGWIGFGIGAAASALMCQQDQTVLFVIALIAVIAQFWSWGVMHNFAMDAARRRSSFRGGFEDITPEEANTAPNWVATINMLSFFASLGLLALALYWALIA